MQISRKAKVITIALATLVLIIGSFMAFATFASYSDGQRAGVVSKFSRRGYIFKTWEGEILIGNNAQMPQGGIGSEKWVFSVYGGNEQAIAKLQQALINGQRVSLHYHEKYFKFWFGDTFYFVDDVQVQK